MARDRQRAKQRRKRQGSPAPRGGRSSASAREIGLDDATVEEAGIGDSGSTPAPNPLKHASADVDEALLAEAGATPPPNTDSEDVAAGVYDDELVDDDFERAPDDAPEDVLVKEPSRRGGAAHPQVAHEHAPARRQRGRVLTFLRHSADELRRVQWPDRRQVGQATAVVLGFVVLAGGYLGLLDAIWKPIVDAIL
jgi:preprotein translocase subunit SecE